MDDQQTVVWAEGVFLGQQHFQLWDAAHFSDLVARQSALHPLGWGLIHCDIDSTALESGEVRVGRCELLLDDGRLIRFRADTDDALTLALPDSGERAEVFVGVPANRSARGITGYPDQSGMCAWEVDYREVADQHDPSRLREVAVARPNIMLLRGDQPREQMSVVKLAECVRSPAGQWQLDEAFVPPVCQIGSSEALIQILRRIEERLAARVRVLDERRARLGSVSDFGPSELSQFLLLQSLRPGLAVLRHHLSVRSAHPEAVFTELVRLLATLSGFHPEAASEPPRYAHDDLGRCFAGCEQVVAAMLSDALPSQMSGVNLVNESDALRVARDLSPQHFQRGTFFLAVRFDTDDPTWISDFARQIKIGAREDIEMILSSALQGVAVTHVQRPPNRLPIKSGYEYFRLEAGGEFWQRIVEHQSLALFVPRDFIAAHVDVLTVEE